QFKYRSVSAKSIFYNSLDDSLGAADVVDDSESLYELVRRKSEAGAEIIERFEISTPLAAFDYNVGDKITTSPDSRDLLGIKNDNRSSLFIEKVKMDFRKQCTDLTIVKRG
ncbi:MAG: hypothetical protein KAI59_04150, partial [Planctomycetes bacterium]|nr:hypothetical protein [Planctomycetota bacterium]